MKKQTLRIETCLYCWCHLVLINTHTHISVCVRMWHFASSLHYITLVAARVYRKKAKGLEGKEKKDVGEATVAKVHRGVIVRA